jgi:hypothetical protein
VNYIILLGIALGLAMDAFSVAIGVSISLGGTSKRQTFRLAWHFGLFQALMPVVGWAAGTSVRPWIEGRDHWLAFILLSVVGGRMILESVRSSSGEPIKTDPTRGWQLVVLSIATSIDALAVVELCRSRRSGVVPGRCHWRHGWRDDSVRHPRGSRVGFSIRLTDGCGRRVRSHRDRRLGPF